MTDTEALLALRERLARLEHEQWVEWSKNLASNELLTGDRLGRWIRLWVDYDELPELVKDQDREWADKVLRLLAPSERERAGALWESARQAIAPDQRLVIWADGGREGSSVPGLTWGQVTAPEPEFDEDDDMVPIRTVMGKTFIEALEALAQPAPGEEG